MEVILLESFSKLGKIGDVVNVKDGFARNYLIPQKKALRANKDNKNHFAKIKNDLLEKNSQIIMEAKKNLEKYQKRKLYSLEMLVTTVIFTDQSRQKIFQVILKKKKLKLNLRISTCILP